MLSKKRKMSPVNAVCVPRFGSQLSSSQRDEPQPDHRSTDQTEPPCQGRRDGHGNKRGTGDKTRFVLKVKLQKSKRATKEDETPRGLMFEPAANKTNPTVGRGGERQHAAPEPDSVGDVFFFSERPRHKALNEKEKTKLAVLRTISRMLEENQLIRERLAAFGQTDRR